jgi:HNH endonuclease
MSSSQPRLTLAAMQRLRDEFERVLNDQGLIVDAPLWRRRRADDGFVREVLNNTYGERDWDRERFDGTPALAHVRAINDAVHCVERSAGAAARKAQVIEAQGGEYCRMCGATSPLQVDHVVPVSRGGAKDDLRNLQLLCQTCNAAKRELDAELLPAALMTNGSATLPPRLRFKRLMLTATESDGRPLGRCDCGRTAQQERLTVAPVPYMAANLLSLAVTCSGCRG